MKIIAVFLTSLSCGVFSIQAVANHIDKGKVNLVLTTIYDGSGQSGNSCYNLNSIESSLKQVKTEIFILGKLFNPSSIRLDQSAYNVRNKLYDAGNKINEAIRAVEAAKRLLGEARQLLPAAKVEHN